MFLWDGVLNGILFCKTREDGKEGERQGKTDISIQMPLKLSEDICQLTFQNGSTTLRLKLILVRGQCQWLSADVCDLET